MAKLKIDLGFSLKRMDLVIKGLTNTKYLGNYKSAFKGTGLEFADYRTYNSGVDDASLIDWKASKRVNQILVREYEEERNINIVFLIDVSSPMLAGSTKQLKAEYVAELVASLTHSVLDAGDSVGFVLFSDKIKKNIPPKMGMQQLYSLTRILSDVSNYGGYSNIDKAIDFAFNTLNEGDLVILISDFIYGISSEKALKLAAKKFNFISIMVRDPRDMALPEGTGEVILEDPYSGNTLLIDPNSIKKEYAAEVSSDTRKIEALMKKYGADFLFLQTDKPFIKELVKFFNMRAAKWR